MTNAGSSNPTSGLSGGTGASSQDLVLADLAQGDELGNQVRTAYAALARRKNDLHDDNLRLKAELDALRGRLTTVEGERAAGSAAATRAQAQAKELTGELEHTRADREALAVQLREAAAKRSTLEADLRQAAARATDLQHQVGHVGHDLELARSECETLRTQLVEVHGRRAALESERTQLSSQLATAQDRAHEVAHDLSQAKLEIDSRAAREERRVRAERELAAEVARLLASDRLVAESATELSAALDEPAAADNLDLAWRLRAAVGALDKRKRDLADEAQRLATEVTSLDQQVSEARERAAVLEHERDEMAASGKEIIAQLSQQRDAREAELDALRLSHETLTRSGHDAATRLADATRANRVLGEALGGLAEASVETEGAPSHEDARIDLELALSQLPAEGEQDVEVPKDIGAQIAAAGQRLAERLRGRHEAATGAFTRGRDEAARLKSALDEATRELGTVRESVEARDSELRRHQAEVAAVRREMSDQGMSLATKVQELTQAKSQVAALTADIGAAQERLREQDRRLAALATQAEERSAQLARAVDELAVTRRRCDAAEAGQISIAQALGSLASGTSTGYDAVSRSAHAFEVAKTKGGDELADAGRALALAVQERARTLAGELATSREDLSASKLAEAQLANQLASVKAALVDRDHALENLSSEHDRAKDDHATALSDLLESRRAADGLAAELKEALEKLRHAQAELDGLHARGLASSGFTNDEIIALRADLAARVQALGKRDAELAELRERLEAADARLRRQREEFQRMLEERDRLIQEKDQTLDDIGAKRVDVKGLEAHVAALNGQLAAANERIKEMEAIYGVHAGVSVKSGDLARDLKKAQAERDTLRERQRQLEGDLADAAGSSAELHTQLDEKRKEVQALREQFIKDTAEDREKANTLREEFRKMKEEVVGLRARLKRLTA